MLVLFLALLCAAGERNLGMADRGNPLEKLQNIVSHFDITGQGTILDAHAGGQPSQSAPSTPMGRERLTEQELRKAK